MPQTISNNSQEARKKWFKHLFTAEFWQEQNHWLAFLTFLLLLTVSVYLYTGEDLSGRNWDLLRSVGERIKALGIPFGNAHLS